MSEITIIPIDFATPEYDQMVRLRDEVLRKPLGLEFHARDLAKEYRFFHLAAYDANLQLVGCLVLAPLNQQEIQMKQVAVKETAQKSGVGKKLVRFSEAFAKRQGYQEMILHARDLAIPFYEKLQYQKEGKPFEEVSIVHFKMRKKL